MNTASIGFVSHYAEHAKNAAKAGRHEKKCKVEERLGYRVARNDLFYHIIKSDIRKQEHMEKYGKGGNLAMYFFDVRG
jgi:hypothetical protein